MTSNDNLNDLMAAANIKLQAQQAQAQRNSQQQDIYADMRAEMENEEANPGTPPTINYSPNQQDDGVEIQHEAIPEEPYFIDEEAVPVFEGGPAIGQVDLWKKQYTKEKVMHTQILDRHFVFRTLNRFEYKQIVAIQNIDALYREEIICNTCVLWPMNYSFKAMAEEDSGYPSTLAQIIMENSGFTKEYGIEVL